MVHGIRGSYTVAEGELREGEYDTDISDDDDVDEEKGHLTGADFKVTSGHVTSSKDSRDHYYYNYFLAEKNPHRGLHMRDFACA